MPDDPFFLKSACIHDRLLEEGYRTAFADSQWFEAALSIHARTWLAYSAMRMHRLVIRAVLQTPDGHRRHQGAVHAVLEAAKTEAETAMKMAITMIEGGADA